MKKISTFAAAFSFCSLFFNASFAAMLDDVIPPCTCKKNCERPEYPRASLRNEETGSVTMAFFVNVDGNVLDSKIARSSGWRKLDNAALEALSAWKFIPMTKDEKLEKHWCYFVYSFRLS